jgi:hypothetical protein
MPAFAAVAHLDTFELAGSLLKRWGLFKSTGVPGLRILRVRGVKTGTEEGPEEFVRYKPTSGWVELDNLRGEIERRAEAYMPPGVDFGEISLEMLDAGATLNWTTETDPYFARWSRAIVPLRTGPGVLFVCGVETASPGVGWLTIVSPRLPHCAINMGDSPCVWLTIDFKRKQADA